MKSNIILLTIATLLVTSTAFGQDDEMRQAIKAGMPGKPHQQLAKLTGSWSVKVRFKIGDDWHEGTATCEANMILGGRFLHQQYSSQMYGNPFTVIQTIGFDNVKQQFIETHMDSMNTGIELREGRLTDDKRSITTQGTSLHPVTKREIKTRAVWTFIDDDTYRIDWYRGEGESDEQHTVSLEHSRTLGSIESTVQSERSAVDAATAARRWQD